MDEPKGWASPAELRAAPAAKEPAPKPSNAMAGVVATLPLFFTFVACGLFGVTGGRPGSAFHRVEEMGLAFYPIFLCAIISALVIAVLLFLMGRGLRIPAVVPLVVAASPWFGGLAGTYLGISIARDAIENADAAWRAMMMARGLSEATQSRLFGALLSSGLLAATGLGLALTAVGQRAPGRRSVGAAVALAALPLVFVALYGTLAARWSGGALALTALVTPLAMLLAGAAAGGDAPHGRSAAMSAATPILAGLAVVAGAVAAMSAATIGVFGALAHAAAEQRGRMLARAAADLGPLLLATHAALPLTLLAGAAAAAWAFTRTRPTVGRVIGGGALVIAALAVVGADHALSTWAANALEEVSAPPWSRVEGFEPIPLADAADDLRSARAIVTPEGLFDLDGDALAPLEPVALTAALCELLEPRDLPESHDNLEPEAGDEVPDEPRLALAIDARLRAASLRVLFAALYDAGWRRAAILGIGVNELSEAQEDSLRAALPVLAAMIRGQGGTEVVIGHASYEPRARRDHVLRHAVVGGALSAALETRAGVSPAIARSIAGPGPVRRLWMARREEGPDVFLGIGDTATAATLFGTAARVRAHEMTPWVVPGAIPGAPTEPALSPTIAPPSFGEAVVDGREVRGSLSREVIRRVVRSHLGEVQACYEQELTAHSELAGRVVVSFVISPSGAVEAAAVSESTLSSQRVEACIVTAVRGWAFPAPDGGGVVAVNYPFVLTSTP